VFLEAVGINPVVVHGGGKAITKAMEKAGIQARFVQGMRVTDEESMEIVEDVLANVINRDIVEMIQKLGGKARSFSGKDVFKCRKLMSGRRGPRLRRRSHGSAHGQGAQVPAGPGHAGDQSDRARERTVTPTISTPTWRRRSWPWRSVRGGSCS
jgi:hypothetical protein